MALNKIVVNCSFALFPIHVNAIIWTYGIYTFQKEKKKHKSKQDKLISVAQLDI